MRRKLRTSYGQREEKGERGIQEAGEDESTCVRRALSPHALKSFLTSATSEATARSQFSPCAVMTSVVPAAAAIIASSSTLPPSASESPARTRTLQPVERAILANAVAGR